MTVRMRRHLTSAPFALRAASFASTGIPAVVGRPNGLPLLGVGLALFSKVAKNSRRILSPHLVVVSDDAAWPITARVPMRTPERMTAFEAVCVKTLRGTTAPEGLW
jgi:hypothetical protein